MKFILLFQFFLYFGQVSWAQKKTVLTPLQTNIQACVDKNIDVLKINDNKKLYKSIEQFYTLSSSETVYREVLYSQKGAQKKLKYEDGVIQIYEVSGDDDIVNLVSSEKFGEKKDDYYVRHKVRSAEARMNQLLFRANIQSDYQKIKETRAKQVILEIIWSDDQIKSLNIEFLGEKKVLNCIQKDQSDICNCRI